jgi:hypothetical protein
MGLFESYPWLTVVLVIVTVELWSAVKAAVAALYRGARQSRRR